MSEGAVKESKRPDAPITYPHEHDVLSGRGNFVNYHPGNEYFRELVRQHKVAYVACPKARKGKFSRMIVDEIGRRVPPGRFLKQDNDTKLWYDIGDKKALDKTRQALREGAPDLLKDMSPDDDEEDLEPTHHDVQEVRTKLLRRSSVKTANFFQTYSHVHFAVLIKASLRNWLLSRLSFESMHPTPISHALTLYFFSSMLDCRDSAEAMHLILFHRWDLGKAA